MKKALFLICLSLCLGLPARAEVDIQTLCKEQREMVNEAIKVISIIQDKSIKDYLYQVWVNSMLEDINKQATSKEIDLRLTLEIYYVQGLAIALKKVDDRVQEYKKDYDNLLDWEKNETVNPYEHLYIKNGDHWDDNPKNYMSFYFSLPYKPNPKYTINNLRKYLQEYVDCRQLLKEGETITRTDRCVKFMTDNKLLMYKPQELANLIIEVMLESKIVTHSADNNYNWADHCFCLVFCGFYLERVGLHKNITLQEATKQIKTAVYALSLLKYNDIMEALNLEFKQKGMSDTQANKEAEKKLDNIIQIYANKLVEKARGGQSVQKKN